MLEKIVILILLCIIGVMAVTIGVLRRQLRRAWQHADSWKLLAEHAEKQANGW